MRDLRLGMEEFFQYLHVFPGQCHRDLKDVKGNVRLSEAIKGEHLHGIFFCHDDELCAFGFGFGDRIPHIFFCIPVVIREGHLAHRTQTGFLGGLFKGSGVSDAGDQIGLLHPDIFERPFMKEGFPLLIRHHLRRRMCGG